jgi:hypothetical protein
MNADSVQKALSFNPSVNLVYVWDDKKTVLKVKPAVRYASKTNYTITLSRTACSNWNVKIASPLQFSFVTLNRTILKLEKSYPVNTQRKISLYPQIRLVFDAPLDPAAVSNGIQFVNEAGTPLIKAREENSETDGKGNYNFELSVPLELNKNYRIVLNPELSDIAGTRFGQTKEILFTTRETAYQTGNIVEPFDDIARFWDPDASGSTIGTDNSLTTFTSSTSIKKSGTASGKLNYVFINQTGGVCRVFNTQKPSVGSDGSKSFGIWVFGDLSYNALEYWFYSSGSTNQIVSVDTIDWAGWDLKIIPFSKIGGSGERLFHSVVITQTTDGAKSGTIYFDDAQLLLPTLINDTYLNEADIYSYPNPFISTSSVSFTLKERTQVKLEVYTLSGQRIDLIFKGESEPGNYVYNWTPSSSVKSGIYLFRLEYHKTSTVFPVVSIKKCILIR